MKVIVNGVEREVPDGLNITALLAEVGVQAERVAVEVNAEVVRRKNHDARRLAAGDRVEIVTFVGGG